MSVRPILQAYSGTVFSYVLLSSVARLNTTLFSCCLSSDPLVLHEGDTVTVQNEKYALVRRKDPSVMGSQSDWWYAFPLAKKGSSLVVSTVDSVARTRFFVLNALCS